MITVQLETYNLAAGLLSLLTNLIHTLSKYYQSTPGNVAEYDYIRLSLSLRNPKKVSMKP